jgi:hypothetical protein
VSRGKRTDERIDRAEEIRPGHSVNYFLTDFSQHRCIDTTVYIINPNNRINNEKAQDICSHRATRRSIDTRLEPGIIDIPPARDRFFCKTDSTTELPARETLWLFQSAYSKRRQAGVQYRLRQPAIRALPAIHANVSAHWRELTAARLRPLQFKRLQWSKQSPGNGVSAAIDNPQSPLESKVYASVFLCPLLPVVSAGN